MSDPFSVAGSAVGVVSLGLTVCQGLIQYYSAWKGYQDDVATLLSSLHGLARTLEVIAQTINGRVFNEEVVKLVQESIGACEHGVLALRKRLDKIRVEDKAGGGPTWNAIRAQGRRAIYPFKQSTLIKLREIVSELRDNLNLAVNALQINSAAASIQKLEQLSEHLERVTINIDHIGANVSEIISKYKDDYWMRIYRWLGAPDHASNHIAARRLKQPGTGNWLMLEKDFIKWREQPGSVLWLHGLPGCGKSILCSTIIETCKPFLQESSSLFFFYFDFNDADKQREESFLRSVIAQTLVQSRDLPVALQNLYSYHAPVGKIPSIDSLRATLKDILLGFAQSLVIIDALDESKERAQVLESVRAMLSWNLRDLRVLITSRRERDIEKDLNGLLTGTISVQSEPVDSDIRLYVRDRLQNDSKLKWPSNVQTEIEESLTTKANGMFRWAACQLDTLRKCLSVSRLRSALTNLPLTLGDTYAQILSAIDHEHQEDALKVLHWLTFSARPLQLREISEVVVVDLNDNPTFDPDRRMRDPQDILLVCSSLVTLVPTSSEDTIPGNSEVKLAHYSVKEYLVSKQITTGSARMFAISATLSNKVIAHTCIAYLLYFDGPDILTADNLSTFPLARYAAEHWIDHAKSGSLDHHLMEQLFASQGLAFTNWIRLCDPDSTWKKPKLSRNRSTMPSPLYYASAAGFTGLVRYLLAGGVDPNSKGGRFGSALHVAAKEGYEEIVLLLLVNSADVNAWDPVNGSPLESAAAGGHTDIGKMLVEAGADMMAPGGENHDDALQAAAWRGADALVLFLLENGADINSRNGGVYGGPLYSAALSGNLSTVKLLLSAGADVNTHTGQFGSPLQAAAVKAHEELVLLLLEHGASVNAEGGDLGTALQAACLLKHERIVNHLLMNGAKINTNCGHFGNPLQAAAFGGEVSLARALLGAGASINLEGGTYGSALEAASTNGHQHIVKFFLEHGADVNYIGGRYKSALRASLSNGHFEVAKLILAAGAGIRSTKDCNLFAAAASTGVDEIVTFLLSNDSAVPSEGGCMLDAIKSALTGGYENMAASLLDRTQVDYDCSPSEYGMLLYEAAAKGNHNIAERLLNLGANFSAQIGQLGAPLHAAAFGGHVEVLRLLIDNNADVNARGGPFGDALQAAAFSGNVESVNLLVAAGANVNTQGGLLGSALEAAAVAQSIEIVQFILSKGAEVNAKGGELGTPLQAAAESGNKNLADMLLNAGADPNIQTRGRFHNALHAAAFKDHHEVTELLLLNGANPNYPFPYYGSLLEAAAAGCSPEIVQLLIDKGASMNATDSQYGSPLQAAAWGGDPRMIRTLLENGADVNCREGQFGQSLYLAALRGSADIVKVLLAHGANADAISGPLGTPLHAAASEGHTKVFETLLTGIKMPLSKLDYAAELLEVAAEIGSTQTLALLMNSGISCEMTGGYFGTALQAAAFGGQNQAVKLLIDNGVDPNLQNGAYMNALNAAAANGFDEIIATLLDAGARIECACALHYAAQNGHESTVVQILDHGADVNSGSPYNRIIALHSATFADQVATVQLLIEKGADVNARDGMGRTPLHIATSTDCEPRSFFIHEPRLRTSPQSRPKQKATQRRKRQWDLVLIEMCEEEGAVMSRQAQISVVDEPNETYSSLGNLALFGNISSLHPDASEADTVEGLCKDSDDSNDGTENEQPPLSTRKRHDLIRLLIKNGSEVEAKDGDGLTPLQLAETFQDKSTVQLLLERTVPERPSHAQVS